jgi:phosphoglucosamine mutase
MIASRKYFGTDGIRGVAGSAPLDPETVVRLGRAIAQIFVKDSRRHRIVVGKDTRLSGYMLESALAAGITSMGADVLLVGPVPTPGVAYLTRSMRADAGIVVSASHNPYEDNGIKIFGADGHKLADELELEIEQLLEGGSFGGQGSHADQAGCANPEGVAPSAIGKASRIEDALGRYTVSLKSVFPREYSLEGLAIGVDAAHGAGYVVAPQTLRELGAEVVATGVAPNGRNINAGVGSLYPEVVAGLVREHRLHAGFALDGDADRCVMVDEHGRVLDGDVLLAICALDLKERGLLRRNAVVATVMSNLGLEKVLRAHGIEVLRTAVGDRFVLEEMVRQGCQLGGEQSGHTIFADYATTGDGLLSALMVLSVMCRTQKPLSELAARFIHFPQRLVNIPVRHKPPLETVPGLSAAIAAKEAELGSSGRVLVRYSGTENKARVMVECEDEAACNRHAEQLAGIIQQELGRV